MGRRIDRYAVGKLLNIKQEESSQVLFLFLHYFFQGVGMALFFTVANTLYFAHFPAEDIPIVFMLSALLQFMLGKAYAYLEHRLPFKVLLFVALSFLCVSPLLFRWGLAYYTFVWLPIAIMVWYRGIALLSDLEFWGLSSTLFDVRQAKRLFGLISAGDVPAKLLGYASVAVLTPAIGLHNLLVVASIAFFASMAFLGRILRTDHSIQAKHHHEAQTTSRPGFLLRVFKSDFILLLAALNVVIAITMSVIDFSFLTEVEEKFHTEEELAAFFSWFYAIANGLIILSKLFFSSRVIDKIGVKYSLMILPIFILGVGLAVFITANLSRDHMPLMMYFAGMVLLGEVFKTVLQEPIFLAMFQPLQRHLRLHAHNVTKGLVEPLGLGLVGLAFYVGIAVYHKINLFTVNYFILALCAGWLALVLFTYRKYMEVLGKAIHKRFIEGSGISLGDKNTLKVITQKLESQHAEEVIYSVELLEKLDHDNYAQYIIKLLTHSSDDVKLHAISKVAKLKMHAAKDALMTIIQGAQSTELKEAAIKAFCAVAEDELDYILELLENEDRNIRNGAILGLLLGGGIEGTVLAGQQLLELSQSVDPNDKVMAANLIGELKMRNFYKPVERFMEEENSLIQESAIRAGGMIKHPKLLPRLTAYLADPKLYTVAADALKNFGDIALQFLQEQLLNDSIRDYETLMRIIHLCGRCGGDTAYTVLMHCYLHDYDDIRVKDAALYTLRLLHYQAADADEAAMFDADIMRQFSLAQNCYRVIAFIKKDGGDPLLQSAVEYESTLAAQRVFALLAFLYNPAIVRRVKDAHLSGSKEHKANALEILDNMLAKKYKGPLFLLLDDATALAKSEELAKMAADETAFVPTTTLDLIERMLGAGAKLLSTWTQAAALYALRNYAEKNQELIKPYLSSKIKILRENAELIINDSAGMKQLVKDMEKHHHNAHHGEEAGSLLEIEKVLVLKSTRLFSETPESILVDIASIVQEERINKDTAIFKKGELGNCMYIIYEGDVRIHDGDTTFVVMKNRDFFGELALLDPEPRSATATALSDTLLLRLEQDAFYEMMSERPEVGRGIMKILCQRLRNQNVQISELRAKAQLAAS